MRYYCKKCNTIFCNNKQVSENVYIIVGMERYNDSDKVKYPNAQFPFHLACIEKFKKEKEYEIPAEEIYNYRMTAFD